jgi:hypothetical protein
MFANFVSERIDDPDQPEIKFFSEHIIAKRNRSKLSLSKGSTPFLDDTSDHISQSFAVPGPVSSSLPDKKSFSYTTAFPVLNVQQLQIVVAERGLAQFGGAGSFLVRELGQGPEISRLQNGENPQLMRDRVRLLLGPSAHHLSLPLTASEIGASLNVKRRRLQSGTDSDVDEDDDENRDSWLDDEQVAEDKFYVAALRRFNKVVLGVIKLQSCLRARPARIFYFRQRGARLRLQRWWRRAKLRLTIRRRVLFRSVVRLQKAFRLMMARHMFLQFRRRIRILQKLYRSRQLRRIYRRTLCCCRKIQSWYRGSHARRLLNKQSQVAWLMWRKQLLYLWTADCTSLEFRSSFWTVLDNARSFVHQALIKEELCRLYQNLSIFPPVNPKPLSFEEQFRIAQNSSLVLKLSAIHSSQRNTAVDINFLTQSAVDEALRSSPQRLMKIRERRSLEVQERLQLYWSMKSFAESNAGFFSRFGLQDLKKRKEKLSNILWVCCNEEYASKSSFVVLAIHGAVRFNSAHCLLHQRISRNCGEAAKSCMLMVQKQR